MRKKFVKAGAFIGDIIKGIAGNSDRTWLVVFIILVVAAYVGLTSYGIQQVAAQETAIPATQAAETFVSHQETGAAGESGEKSSTTNRNWFEVLKLPEFWTFAVVLVGLIQGLIRLIKEMRDGTQKEPGLVTRFTDWWRSRGADITTDQNDPNPNEGRILTHYHVHDRKGTLKLPSAHKDGETDWEKIIAIGNGNQVFEDAAEITTVVIPKHVVSIGKSAFVGFQNLKSVRFEQKKTGLYKRLYIMRGAFENPLSKLDKHKLGRYNTRGFGRFLLEVDSDDRSTTGEQVMITGYYGTPKTDGLAIPEDIAGKNIVAINKGAFRDCKDLKSIFIPKSVTSIGDEAFSRCTFLKSVTIPNSVISIGGKAFYGCIGLTRIIIPESVISIGRQAFDACTGLTSVKFEGSNTALAKRDVFPNGFSLFRAGGYSKGAGLPFKMSAGTYTLSGDNWTKQ